MKPKNKYIFLLYPIVFALYGLLNYILYHKFNLLFKNSIGYNLIPLFVFIAFVVGSYKAFIKSGGFYGFVAALFAFTIVMPFFFIDVPFEWRSPDIAYNAAKIWRAYEGHIFVDSVTGYLSIYPSLFHLFWAGVMYVLPVTPPKILVFSSIFSMAFLIFASFMLSRKFFGAAAGALAVILLGLLFYWPVRGYIMLATNNTFSMGFFVLGLYFFYKGFYENTTFIKYAGLLFGIAATLWPNYLFFLFIVFIVFAAFECRSSGLIKKLMVLLFFFFIPLIYLAVQTIVIARAGLLGSNRVQLCNGAVNFKWLWDFICNVIYLGESPSAPASKTTVVFMTVNYIVLISLAILSLFCRKATSRKLKLPPNNTLRFIIILCIGFVLGMIVLNYFFNPSYPTRVQIMLNVLIAGLAANFLVNYILPKAGVKYAGILLIIYFTSASIYYNTTKFKTIAGQSQKYYLDYVKYEKAIVDRLADITTPDDRIFSTKETFRASIMANIPRYGLLAHRDGNYFYLDSKLSAQMLNDYNTILAAGDINAVNRIMDKYSMRYSFVYKADMAEFPGLGVIYLNYGKIYENNYFVILKRF